MKDDWKNDFQSSFFMLIIIINDYPQNYPYEDESSNYHGQYIPPTASRQAPPVHEATGGHAVAITAYIIMFEVILRIII